MKNSQPSKLTGVYLKGFQTLVDPVFLQLNGLTMLYGPNSAGKSAIHDALNLFQILVGHESSTYRLGHLLSKNSANGTPPVVGVEVFVGKLNLYSPDEQIWQEQEAYSWEEDVVDLVKSLTGKKIQIQFSGDFDSIAVAIDYEPVFEMIGLSASRYDSCYKAIASDEMDDDFGVEGVWGEIRIYKSSKYAKKLFPKLIDPLSGVHAEKWSDRHCLDIFFKSTETVQTVFGISLDVDRFHQKRRIDVGLGADSALFRVLPPDYHNSSLEDKDEANFLYQYFDPKSVHFKDAKNRRVNIYWLLEDSAKYLDIFFDGLIFILKDALSYGHVDGDRRLLSSKQPFYCSDLINLGIPLVEFPPHICQYAKRLNEDFSASYSASRYIGDHASKDFPNAMLEGVLRTFGIRGMYAVGYHAEAQEEHRREFADLEVVYIRLKDEKGNSRGFEDVGSGISYTLPVLTCLWMSRLAFIEQPELHLHPKAQCELGDVFVAALNYGTVSIIESHSEHILLRILRRIREANQNTIESNEFKISNDQLSIYYFKPQGDGTTKVKQIRVDRFGEFMNTWPDGFFSEREAELF